MHGRLAALRATEGCLNLEKIQKLESAGTLDPESKAFVDDNAKLREFLRTSMEHADAVLAEHFWGGEDVVQLVHSRAWVVEQLLLLSWRKLVPFTDHVSLVAVGGYGRGELHPGSDIDLLILLGDDIDKSFLNNEIEAFVQLLWDAGFYLGHSVRTLSESVEDAEDDVATATSFMESRLLAGSMTLLNGMLEETSPEHMWGGRAFFEAKYEEQIQRHERFHDTAYNLEPNIKEGPGGLRDIQMISWVARRHLGAETLHGLVEHGYATPAEHRDLVGGQHLLWRIRYALHLLAGRAEDRLLFDFQRQIAERFGFTGSASSLAVEQFMQLYYRTVMRLERLNESLLQLFREALLSSGKDEIVEINEDFQARGGFVELRKPTVFEGRPAAMMELFVLLASHENLLGVTASTIRTIREHLYLVDEDFRADAGVNASFLDLLRQPEGVYTQLRRMNRYGLLAAYMPAFGNIVGRMQYDLFHVYTVDQHTLFCVRNLRRFAYGKYKERFPHARLVFKRIAKPELLYLAAIFHDIAKGRGGDHSELGAVDAEAFCMMLDIEPGEREMVAWLVRHHLKMSQTSQKKDLSDPLNVQEFAELVGNTRYLDHLYLLTVADIAATSPKLWNNWKNKLLWELYLSSGEALRRGLENPIKRATRIRETRAAALSRLIRRGADTASINQLWETLPEYAFWRLSPDQLEWTTESVVNHGDAERYICMRPVQPHGVSELLVCVPDYSGLFASITSIVDEMGLDIMSARVLTTKNSRSHDLFQLMDQHGDVVNPVDSEELLQRLDRATRNGRPRAPVKRTLPRRLRHFSSHPKIRYAKDPDGDGTVLHIHCNDRPGLLSCIAVAIFSKNVQVHNARIATFGERVEDTFLVSDEDHRPLDSEARDALAQSLKTAIEEG